MATSLPYYKVVLNEEDVPGASFGTTQPCQLSKAQIERWLKCRNMKTKGTKTELILRVEECIKNNIPIYQGIDGGRQLQKKSESIRTMHNKNMNKPPPFPVKWNTFPSLSVPRHFSMGSIYSYLKIECHDESNKENDVDGHVFSSKPFRKGRQYVASGYVSDIMDGSTKNCTCYKATVKASFTQSRSYIVMTMLQNDTGDIVDAACDCKGSATGRCAHVTALLFTIEQYIMEHGNNPLPPTSLPCKWNNGKKRKNPKEIGVHRYNDNNDSSIKEQFDPRLNICSNAEKKHKYNNFLRALSSCEGAKESVPSFLYLCEIKYDDYTLTYNEAKILKTKVKMLQCTLTNDSTSEPCIEPCEIPGTTAQATSSKWNNLRRLLITASDYTHYLKDKNPKQLFNLVRTKLWTDTLPICSKYLKYGKENEDNALTHYMFQFPHFKVVKTGLWINPCLPGLGASPDALVYDENATSPNGLLEIKCPYLIRDMNTIDLTLLNSTQRSSFCLKSDGNNCLYLKTTHKYWYQIQMQMAVTNRKWCDFYVWSKNCSHYERVEFNPTFWEPIGNKLIKFHEEIICPEYFEYRTLRRLYPFCLKM